MIGVDVGLLIDASDALQSANVEDVLRAQIALMCRLDLAASLLIVFLLFKRLDLGFGQNAAICGDAGFQGFQVGFEVCQIMPQPDRPHA